MPSTNDTNITAILETLAGLEGDARDVAISELPDEVLRAIADGWPELGSLTEDQLVILIDLLDRGVSKHEVDAYVRRAARGERADA